jgi:hypothetical protein
MNNTPIGMDENRIRHSLSVAQKAAELGRILMKWDDEKCKEMFILGYLHDIGYEYACKHEDHSSIGGELLRKNGYKYWREVFWHGKVTDEFKSDELDIINLADLQIDHTGEDVGVAKRLEGIKRRYGSASEFAMNAEKLANSLNALLTRIEN